MQKKEGTALHKLQTIIKLILMLPGTLLHELAHFFPALLFNTNPSLSLLPSFQQGTAARVTFREPAFSFAKTVISLMPIIWWIALAALLMHFNLLDLTIANTYRIDIAVMYNPSLTQSEYVLIAFTSIQLLWAGSLSRSDWENAIDGLASLSGIVMISALIAWWHYMM